MTPFSTFSFSQSPSRRHQMLADVMPTNESFVYVVVLADAYLSVEGHDRHICGFREFCDVLGIQDAMTALRVARTEGQLTEGRHALPDAVAEYLIAIGKGQLHVRGWAYGASAPVHSSHALTRVQEIVPDAQFVEIEVCDSAGTWYLRARDDDPLVFISLCRELLPDLLKRSSDYCQTVGADFEYAA